ncbi:putative sugar O-methyltransferase [Thalassobaculum sp.]|uniref:putative sugar O-methyltransferase n=1 Tax=Thalassobaculum sp. TaxID=2022740 RepID=UPI003B590749
MDTYKLAQELVETDPVESEVIFRRIFKKTGLNLHDTLVNNYKRTEGLETLIRNIALSARRANMFLERGSKEQDPSAKNYVDLDRTVSEISNGFIINQHNLISETIDKNPVVAPSQFWRKHLINHVKMLIDDGIDNFKRTLGHNYINFLNKSPASIHFKSHLDLWKLHGSTDVFLIDSDAPGSIGLKADVQHFNSVQINNAETWRVYTFLVSLMWEYAIIVDEHKILTRLQEPLYGNPLKIRRRSRLIGQDLTHSVAEYSLIKSKTNLQDDIRVLEIGSGYGRLAHLYKYLGAKKYVMVDISPAIIVAQNYMHNIMPNLKYFDFRPIDNFQSVEREFEEADVCFMSADQIALLPDKYFDLAINVCSLMEMKLETIDYYLKQISRTTTGYFYTKQWTLQKNLQDKIQLTKDDYPIPSDWTQIADRVDPAFTRLFEQIWKVK